MANLGKVVITPKGEYNSVTQYVKLDCVYHEGCTWLAKRPVQGISPVDGDDWTMLAQGFSAEEKDLLYALEESNRNKIQVIDNIASLKSTDFVEGDLVQTKGYYSNNDGGNGTYLIVNNSSLIEDGGLVHNLSNGMKAVLLHAGTISVKQFGAKGNNNNNDSPCIQAALNSSVRTIYVPYGQYAIYETLIINPKWGGRIVGDGIYSILSLKESTDLMSFSDAVEGATGIEIRQFEIHNLSFIGNGLSSGDLLRIINASAVKISKCYFRNFTTTGNGIYVEGNRFSNESCHDIDISDCYFDSSTGGNAAIYLSPTAADMTIHDNYMELRHSTDYCILINDSGSLQVYNNHIYNSKKNIVKINGCSNKTYNFINNFFDNSLNDIFVIDGDIVSADAGQVLISECIIFEIKEGYSGFKITSNTSNIKIKDCVFLPQLGALAAINVISNSTVDYIEIEGNKYYNSSHFTNGTVCNLTGVNSYIDGLNAVGVQTLEPSISNAVGSIEYIKSKKTVQLDFNSFVPSGQEISAWSSLTIGTLPIGYRPVKNVSGIPLFIHNKTTPIILSINTGGVVSITTLQTSITFGNGDAIRGGCTFVVA